jgi:ATP-binding cassette subfamily B protein
MPRLVARASRLVWDASPREVTIVLALQIACGLGLAAQLLLGRSLIKSVVDRNPGSTLWDVAPALAVLAAVTISVASAATFMTERQRVLTSLVERHTVDRVLDVVAAVPLSAFESGGFHDRLVRAVTNAAARALQVAAAIVGVFSAAAMVLPLAIVLGGIEPLLLPAIIIAYLPLHFATVRNNQSFYDFSYAQTTPDRERRYLGGLLMGSAAVKEVRLFDSARWIRDRYDGLYDRRIQELAKLVNLRTRRSLAANAWSTVIIVTGIGLLVHWAMSGRISTADAGIAAIAIYLAGSRIRTAGAAVGSLQECSLFLNDVIGFIDLPTEAETVAANAPAAPDGFQTLTVDRLNFTYPGTDVEVLTDLSLTIGKEEVVALVGANGSGKTTLGKVLLGLYPPTSGRVLWDDTDVSAVDPASLRRNVAAAFQDFIRYELSGRHNIGLGDVDRMDDDAIAAAARAVGADSPLSRLPAGYDTRLSRAYDDGADLSLGEWQRVALARAFLRDAPLLVLDEPTASLDPHSERELFASMRELRRGRAVLLISHRFASVRSADRIYVLDSGRVVESGRHEELMAADGLYAEMFTLQAEAYGEPMGSR